MLSSAKLLKCTYFRKQCFAFCKAEDAEVAHPHGDLCRAFDPVRACMTSRCSNELWGESSEQQNPYLAINLWPCLYLLNKLLSMHLKRIASCNHSIDLRMVHLFDFRMSFVTYSILFVLMSIPVFTHLLQRGETKLSLE